jgi:hypothetical protein
MVFVEMKPIPPLKWVVKPTYRNLTLRECEDETHTPEMGTWESIGIPKSLEFNCNGQNTLH